MPLIDPIRHVHLIELQRAVTAAFDALDAHAGPDDERPALREQARQAAAAKQAALHASGLPAEYGYHQADQALKQAAKATG